MSAAADYWSNRSLTGYAPNWYSLCRDVINERVTGSPKNSLFLHLLGKHAPPDAEDMLEIGCLSGRKISNMGKFAKRLHGADIAEGALEEGRKLRPNVRFDYLDLNKPHDLGVQYDIIITNGVLHHVENLEAGADWIAGHLTPRGVLIASEFVGPVRYRYSRAEIDAINNAIDLLPEELRKKFDPASLASKLRKDPSESIRSRDIVDTLRASGLTVQAIPYGGNTLMRALGPHFFEHFNPNLPEHRDGLKRVIDSDWEAMQKFPSHHVVMIAQPMR